MNRRQLFSHIRYLRRLYATMDAFALAAKTPRGKKRADMTSQHLKCSVTLLLDAYDAEPRLARERK